ncbi:androgen dependent TFPI regulating protein 1 isoform X2 [Trichomycterus rosablanca]|uniref:androgen dependent TFPI regulating protein 1 isoform X2 n=1 Tax=Trichomycterus rosablanca TaxID=2290929 RepID=UPI002F353CA6
MAAADRRSSVYYKLYLFVHLVIFGWYVFILKVNCSSVISNKHPGARSYGGRWKYLTFINMVMQTVFFGLCAVTDLVHVVLPRKSATSGFPAFLLTVQDFFFAVLAFPVGTFVFTSFWSIYSYDRELVFPKFLDDIIPTWHNHAMHTVIMPLLLLQMFLQHHRYPSRSKGIFSLAVFVASYLAWVLWVRHASGIWVYPIMAHLSPVGLVLFLAVASLSMAPLYLLGEKISAAIWGPTGKQKKK